MSVRVASGSTASTTFSFRVGGNNAGTVTVNGFNGGALYGGVLNSFFVITEIEA
jgi:hypothetical protein